MDNGEQGNTNKISFYFNSGKKELGIVTITGVLYNLGMVAGPWFEGQLAQCLWDIIAGKRVFKDMAVLAGTYVLVIVAVQGARFLKRLYIRKFANSINKLMKQFLYGNLVRTTRRKLEQEGAGNLMTKAIADVDTCVEGMRKFTTEIFDTGVVMIAYLAMLLYYDWRLALLSMIFPPIAYVVAERLKNIVTKSAAAYKESAGRLNAATLDRITNSMTYRVYGQEEHVNQLYEDHLTDYEKKAATASIWETSMQPIYQLVATLSVIFILWFGGKNVLGTGWATWNIAAFTTFLSCFMKLALKSSKAAKLFNAVQKARVSWQRVKPYLQPVVQEKEEVTLEGKTLKLQVEHLSFRYDEESSDIIRDINFELKAGEVIGVAGPVACGKSTLGKVFLCEEPYGGHVYVNGRELSQVQKEGIRGITAYLGHKPELLSTSIEENILLGEEGDVWKVLEAVCLDKEVATMPEGIHTNVGNGGVTLSGGQQARLALARTLFHKNSLMVLDDPFSAVDIKTEHRIMENLRPYLADSVTILLSHRLALFPELSRILWMGNNSVGTHEELMRSNPQYAEVYNLQMGGGTHAN